MMKAVKIDSETQARFAEFGSPRLDVLIRWANKQLTCSHCRRCTLRCEVLKEPALDIGRIEEHYEAIMALPVAERDDAVIGVVTAHPELYHALRRCCFCGYCTAVCQHHLLGADRMRDWRELFMKAGLMPPENSRTVMVDNEWHIFSAYRAIYGIAYPEFTSLEQAATAGPGVADTLLFPGCSLVSYAPELVRAVGGWLDGVGLAWALSDDCCGSPLMSAGLFERAEGLRRRILDRIRAAGIKRVITVCPGCGEELTETFGDEVDVVPLPEILLAYGTSADGFAPLKRETITFFDSCHDRADNRHANAIRALMARHLPSAQQVEIDHRKRATLCCGAGGAVAGYDDDLTARRVWRVIDEARATGAETLITMCPTCTYTIAQACLGVDEGRGIDSHHYLETLFGMPIDWQLVFYQLNAMWTGEYGPWLTQTFFS